MSAQRLLQDCRAAGLEVSARNGQLVVVPGSALPEGLRARLAANKSELLDYLNAEKRLHTRYVLHQLDNLQLHRDGNVLVARRRQIATDHQRELMATYEDELLEALRHRSLSGRELEILALLAHDTGQDSRDFYELAAMSPEDREFFLWVHDGKPELAEVEQ